MKLIFCAVILSAAAILSVKGLDFHFRDRMFCRTWANYWDHKKLYYDLPTTRQFKCLYLCQLKYDGLVNEDGLIDVNKFFDYIAPKIDAEKKYSDNKQNLLKILHEVMDVCKNHKHLSGDGCETVGLLLECMVGEAKKRGVENTGYTLDLFSHPLHRGY